MKVDAFRCNVMGLAYRDNVTEMMTALEQCVARHAIGTGPPPLLTLRHDRENGDDPSAVAVDWGVAHLGYLPRWLAANVCSRLAEGWTVEVVRVQPRALEVRCRCAAADRAHTDASH